MEWMSTPRSRGRSAAPGPSEGIGDVRSRVGNWLGIPVERLDDIPDAVVAELYARLCDGTGPVLVPAPLLAGLRTGSPGGSEAAVAARGRERLARRAPWHRAVLGMRRHRVVTGTALTAAAAALVLTLGWSAPAGSPLHDLHVVLTALEYRLGVGGVDNAPIRSPGPGGSPRASEEEPAVTGPPSSAAEGDGGAGDRPASGGSDGGRPMAAGSTSSASGTSSASTSSRESGGGSGSEVHGGSGSTSTATSPTSSASSTSSGRGGGSTSGFSTSQSSTQTSTTTGATGTSTPFG